MISPVSHAMVANYHLDKKKKTGTLSFTTLHTLDLFKFESQDKISKVEKQGDTANPICVFKGDHGTVLQQTTW